MLIGEVSKRSGVSVRMLRHYDRIGIVRPSSRSATGYREYDPGDTRRLLQVEALRALGLTLAQTAAALDDPRFDAAEVIARLRRETEHRIAQERALLDRLHEIEATAPEGWEEVLDVVGLLAALRSGTAADRQSAALRTGAAPSRIVGRLIESYLEETEINAAGALRWAIVQAGDAAVSGLAERAEDPDAGVRLRVVLALGDIPGPAASAALAARLADADAEVADRAALVLGRREAADTPDAKEHTSRLRGRLMTMIVSGSRDVEAAETLGVLAARSAEAERSIVGALAEGLEGARRATSASGARSRLAQALGEIPGPAAPALLRRLVGDPDPAVARVATYLVGLRGAGEVDECDGKRSGTEKPYRLPRD